MNVPVSIISLKISGILGQEKWAGQEAEIFRQTRQNFLQTFNSQLKFSTEEIMCAQDFTPAPKCPPPQRFSAPNLAFFERNFF